MTIAQRVSNRRRRLAIDRITNLHESMISSILSHLPTKEAVRTSVLSKEWRRKWVLTDNVDTDLTSWDMDLSFARFLDEMVITRKHLRCFRAIFYGPGSDNERKWIMTALEHNLEYLDVSITRNGIVIPFIILNHTALREVKFAQTSTELVTIVSVLENNSSPRVTSLHLHNIAFMNRNYNFSTLSFDFPVLETLEFRGNRFNHGLWKNVKCVEINAPSLTSFVYEPRVHYDSHYSIKIVAPRLTRFTCYKEIPDVLILDGSLVVSAILTSRPPDSRLAENESRVTDLVNGFINLEELTLSWCMAKVLRNGPPLHCHDKLQRLTLFSGSRAHQLFMLLHAMPSLKFLSVNVVYWQDYDYGAMEMTPSCIESCLEEVVLQEFNGDRPQYKLARFLLKTAEMLKKFTIAPKYAGRTRTTKMKNVLSKFKICSPSLKICSRLPDIEQYE